MFIWESSLTQCVVCSFAKSNSARWKPWTQSLHYSFSRLTGLFTAAMSCVTIPNWLFCCLTFLVHDITFLQLFP